MKSWEVKNKNLGTRLSLANSMKEPARTSRMWRMKFLLLFANITMWSKRSALPILLPSSKNRQLIWFWSLNWKDWSQKMRLGNTRLTYYRNNQKSLASSMSTLRISLIKLSWPKNSKTRSESTGRHWRTKTNPNNLCGWLSSMLRGIVSNCCGTWLLRVILWSLNAMKNSSKIRMLMPSRQTWRKLPIILARNSDWRKVFTSRTLILSEVHIPHRICESAQFINLCLENKYIILELKWSNQTINQPITSQRWFRTNSSIGSGREFTTIHLLWT